MQKWPNTLFLIRHGQSDRNVMKDAAKAAGHAPVWCDGVRDQDTPLTVLGRLQALSVGVHLRDLLPHPGDLPRNNPGCSGTSYGALETATSLDAVFMSPYLRARQTTDEIVKSLGYKPKIVVEERIREIEFGILDGLTPEGIRVKYPEEVARRAKEGKYYYRPPGGENRPDVNLRCHSFIDTLVRDYHEQNVAVVCHSVVVLCMRHLLERWDEDEYLQVDREQDVRNASLTTYICENNKIRLRSYNEVFYDA